MRSVRTRTKARIQGLQVAQCQKKLVVSATSNAPTPAQITEPRAAVAHNRNCCSTSSYGYISKIYWQHISMTHTDSSLSGVCHLERALQALTLTTRAGLVNSNLVIQYCTSLQSIEYVTRLTSVYRRRTLDML
ncbi:Hypothetical predicted protein [Olea europaea subsp. europaea]|uniref:Uncharacterized protein n=1 Tax=Olea europaea subsp. europaea TaxID=158383 RepID=A0A8S0UJN4_OLEEU|nr:Hypothetical predicted protein [Olea europaea subsp. europaea]